MTSLHRLIYYSRNAIPGSEQEIMEGIRQILESSRKNNAEADVTGALMFNKGCFAQILEGPRSALEHTFERIQRDFRHGDVVVLEYAPLSRRSFANWSMAFVGGDTEDASRFGNIGAQTGFDPANVSAEAVFSTLHRLVGEEENTAA